MMLDKEKAPPGSGAYSVNVDLLAGEIKRKYTTNPTPRQVSGKLPTAKISALKARLPFALDAQVFPILAQNWPLDVRQDLLRQINRELGGLRHA